MSAAGAAGGAAPGRRHAFDARADPFVRLVFVLLVAACLAAFFVTQRLKHSPTLVQRFERTPTFDPRSAEPARREEQLSFKLSLAGTVTVSVVDTNLSVVAVLVRERALPRYKQFSLRWNGRRGVARRFRELVSRRGHRTLVPLTEGAPAAPGEYRVRVDVRGHGSVYSPWSFTLVAP